MLLCPLFWILFIESDFDDNIELKEDKNKKNNSIKCVDCVLSDKGCFHYKHNMSCTSNPINQIQYEVKDTIRVTFKRTRKLNGEFFVVQMHYNKILFPEFGYCDEFNDVLQFVYKKIKNFTKTGSIVKFEDLDYPDSSFAFISLKEFEKYYDAIYNINSIEDEIIAEINYPDLPKFEKNNIKKSEFEDFIDNDKINAEIDNILNKKL